MENKKLTILPDGLKGTVLVTGELGVGKTTFALTADIPQNVGMIDMDEKGSGIAEEELHINKYFAPTTEYSEPWRVWDAIEQWVNDLPENELTVVVFDNVSAMEDGARQKVERNAKYYAEKYNLKEKNILSGSFGGASPAASQMISELVAKLQSKGVRLVIQVAHTGNKWVTAGIVPGKRTIKGLARWDKLSILSLVLIPPRAEELQIGVPAALVRKEQLASYTVPVITPEKAERMKAGEGGIMVRRRLPRRIFPCTWQTIKGYLQKPADFQNPNPSEIPLPEEIQPYEEKLTHDQISYITAQTNLTWEEMKRENETSDETLLEEAQLVTDMIDHLDGYDGEYTPVAIKQALNAINITCNIPMAVKVLNRLREME